MIIITEVLQQMAYAESLITWRYKVLISLIGLPNSLSRFYNS
jgi:hypothetical protein